MARILLNEEWYDQVTSSALYESDFERIIREQSATLYPDYYLTSFKTVVQSDYGNAMPDLALVDKECRSWWVVEIEKGDHDFFGHVFPQVQVLARASYGSTEADVLSIGMPSIDKERLRVMMKGSPPSVLVVVNVPRPDWVAPLKSLGALLQVFEVFRSRKNRQVYRLNGDYPAIPPKVLTRCLPDPALPNWLILDAPAALSFSSDGKVTLLYGEGITIWQRVEIYDRVWLQPERSIELDVKSSYEILNESPGRFTLRLEPVARDSSRRR
jgi:hypothetical protein